MTAESDKAKYKVKTVQMIVAGSDLRARLYTLAPSDVIPWHFHSQVSDWYFCLAGELAVEIRTPSDRRIVEVDGNCAIPPDTAHQISSGGKTECRFLLIQGVGQYDFHAVEVR